MNLFLTRIFQNNTNYSAKTNQKQNYSYMYNLKNTGKDTFIKSTSQTFKGSGSKTKAGDVLKELDNITCPYSGVKMISFDKMNKIEHRLDLCRNLSEGIDVLDKHKQSMQKLEKNIYGKLKDYQRIHPNSTANDYLQSIKPECLAKLRIEEFKVLDNIDKLSNKMTPEQALEIRRITTNARKQILDDKTDQVFKRKDLLTDLAIITKENNNSKLADEIWNTANKLPKSATNFDAFVVKYANRSQKEIMARLLRPSVASIEHITPKSINPDHTLANFMLTSRDWNSDRGNTPLPEYIKSHPNIPKYCQRYANDIIKAIKKDKLKNSDWYPYLLKEKLYNESDGIINVSLKEYSKPESEAFKNAPEEFVEKYNNLKELNKSIPQKDM